MIVWFRDGEVIDGEVRGEQGQQGSKRGEGGKLAIAIATWDWVLKRGISFEASY